MRNLSHLENQVSLVSILPNKSGIWIWTAIYYTFRMNVIFIKLRLVMFIAVLVSGGKKKELVTPVFPDLVSLVFLFENVWY